MVDGKTSKNERKQILRDFKDMKLKYLVNVSVLTTGFDAPHVDVVAVLRATESAGLFQQIIGRGTRLYEGKTNFLVLDYAENISRHELHESLFKPTITAGFKSKGGGNMTAICPVCAFENQVTARPNPDGYEINEYGNFTDALGEEVLTDDGRPYPAHFGRSCQSFLLTDKSYVQCSHKFTSKKCTECGHDNDISARRCKACRHELIDPNEKLKLDYEKFKSDPRKLSVDNVLAWTIQRWHSQSGNDMVKVEYTTEYRTFPVWYSPKIRATWLDFTEQVFGIQTTDIYDVFSRISIGKMPKTITVVKDGKFYKVTKHNESQKANSAYFR
jgi:DNA repair protein RadD